MILEFHPKAFREYREAAIFDESRRPGLGAAFSVEAEATIQRTIEAPDCWPIVEQNVHTCRSHTFPYAVLYTIEPSSILILAVMHLRREPGYWRNRASLQP